MELMMMMMMMMMMIAAAAVGAAPFQLCFRICHQQGLRKPGRIGIEWNASAPGLC
jgi:hypothetical protein